MNSEWLVVSRGGSAPLRVPRVVATAVRVLLMSFGLKLIIYLLNPPVQWLVVSGDALFEASLHS
ncbi:MAG: hypothetical protein IGS49_04690 [Chlorogloeopsis fritschii C42_A2020_084]|uniref:hypothetical protein n=1 Tax=Chlorogloeopsis fritschii TaxID=1124 RepID=UPI0019FBDF62|nr:hypothetical protein [Chlorogloeopsis fritschii]MBF2004764.1 hypothetical protein [Chlorogloeopsis fritschii C42_A2020_084]